MRASAFCTRLKPVPLVELAGVHFDLAAVRWVAKATRTANVQISDRGPVLRGAACLRLEWHVHILLDVTPLSTNNAVTLTRNEF